MYEKHPLAWLWRQNNRVNEGQRFLPDNHSFSCDWKMPEVSKISKPKAKDTWKKTQNSKVREFFKVGDFLFPCGRQSSF